MSLVATNMPNMFPSTLTNNDIKFKSNLLKIIAIILLNTIPLINIMTQANCWIVDFNNPVAQTQHGSIRGKIDERRTKFNRRPICTFLSIPYARPPIGANRFLPPVDPDPWQNLEAIGKRVMCPQVEQRFRLHYSSQEPILESEDCLYLNVFIPVDRATPVINYPVIVYIHGGEFKHGCKDHYSPEYLLDHGVILVTINYRLGVLGFLSTDDLAAPGNLGLYDQIAALRWVKRNIQSFGGNGDDITLMGHNAGAISASLLILAPHETQGLIHKVIAIGGSAFSPAALQWNPGRQAREFARSLRCMSERSDDIIRCLRLKDWQTLVAAQRQSHNFEQNTFRHWFRPVLDRNSSFSLLRAHPHELYSGGSFLRVPLMMGVSAHEGSLEFFLHWHQLRPLNSLQRIQFLIRPYLYEFARAEIVATTLNYNYVSRTLNSTGFVINGGSQFHHNGQQLSSSLDTPTLLAQRLTPSGHFWHEQTQMGFERNEYDVYIGANDFASKEIVRQIDAIGDFLFVAPAVKQLELHSQSVSQSYMFVFDYKGTRSFGHIQLNPYGRARLAPASDRDAGEPLSSGFLPGTPTRMGAIISTETSNFGVSHCDDLFYLMPNDFAPLALNSIDASNLNDENAIRSYVTYLVAFASHINEGASASQGQGSGNSVSNNLANWLPFRSTDRNYIRFSEQLPTLYKNFRNYDVAFVNELVEPLEDLVNTPLPLFPYEELRDLKISTIGLGLLLAIIVLTLLMVLCFLICARKKRRLRRLDEAILMSGTKPAVAVVEKDHEKAANGVDLAAADDDLESQQNVELIRHHKLHNSNQDLNDNYEHRREVYQFDDREWITTTTVEKQHHQEIASQANNNSLTQRNTNAKQFIDSKQQDVDYYNANKTTHDMEEQLQLNDDQLGEILIRNDKTRLTQTIVRQH